MDGALLEKLVASVGDLERFSCAVDPERLIVSAQFKEECFGRNAFLFLNLEPEEENLSYTFTLQGSWEHSCHDGQFLKELTEAAMAYDINVSLSPPNVISFSAECYEPDFFAQPSPGELLRLLEVIVMVMAEMNASVAQAFGLLARREHVSSEEVRNLAHLCFSSMFQDGVAM